MARYTVIFALVACVLIVGALATGDQIGPECGCTCKRNLQPVCGKNSKGEFKRFGNQCLLDCENSCLNKDYDKTELSSCSA
ncbi:Hypothetical predicted protein [Cloeon dipterum]|uniref:Kazal-like domain-containing protein n=1 Tax=Cloeon dipterum TaxID=197152 RepID=A0A8S1DRN4_9INSE|nr:Hypothetical predicted protein [Cloeon dipterum]